MMMFSGNKKEIMATMPTAVVPLLPKDEEQPVAPPVKYVPRRHQTEDREAMARAMEKFDSLQRELDQAREHLKQAQTEISHMRQSIDLLEQALAHSKNEATTYRAEADEAKAQTASWKVLFANVKALFTEYSLPDGTPKRIAIEETKNDDGQRDK